MAKYFVAWMPHKRNIVGVGQVQPLHLHAYKHACIHALIHIFVYEILNENFVCIRLQFECKPSLLQTQKETVGAIWLRCDAYACTQYTVVLSRHTSIINPVCVILDMHACVCKGKLEIGFSLRDYYYNFFYCCIQTCIEGESIRKQFSIIGN